MASVIFFALAFGLLAIVLGYWSPKWSDFGEVLGRLKAAAMNWRSLRGVLFAFALILLLTAAFAASKKTVDYGPDGSRASVYEAVKSFQSANHLTVDGVVGPATFKKLYR